MNIVKLSERVARIEAEISGVVSQSGITQWELNFLDNLKKLRFGSDAQRVILERIEKKVFGETFSDTTGISDTKSVTNTTGISDTKSVTK